MMIVNRSRSWRQPKASQLSPRSSKHLSSSCNSLQPSQLSSVESHHMPSRLITTGSFEKDSLEVDNDTLVSSSVRGTHASTALEGFSLPHRDMTAPCQRLMAASAPITTDGDILSNQLNTDVVRPSPCEDISLYGDTIERPASQVGDEKQAMELGLSQISISRDSLAEERLLGCTCATPEPGMASRNSSPIVTEIAGVVASHLEAAQLSRSLVHCNDENEQNEDNDDEDEGHLMAPDAVDKDEGEETRMETEGDELTLPLPPSLASLLRPLSEMTRAELVRVCENLEASLAYKDKEVDVINRQYEQLLELYHDTAELLALRNHELVSCKTHLQDASSSLQHWKNELLHPQVEQVGTGEAISSTESSSACMISKTRQVLAAAATICDQVRVVSRADGEGTEKGEIYSEHNLNAVLTDERVTGQDYEGVKALKTSLSDDDLFRSTKSYVDSTNDIKHSKRAARRLAQSQDCRSMARIVPVLHRRRSDRSSDGRPTPKPRKSILFPDMEEPTQNWDTSETAKSGEKSSFAEVFQDGVSLHCTAPERLSHVTDQSQINILRIDESIDDVRPDTADTLYSEDSLPTDRRPPTVIERLSFRDTNEAEQPEQRAAQLVDCQTSRPRTGCGRPLTGEKRPITGEGERPPTRSGSLINPQSPCSEMSTVSSSTVSYSRAQCRSSPADVTNDADYSDRLTPRADQHRVHSGGADDAIRHDRGDDHNDTNDSSCDEHLYPPARIQNTTSEDHDSVNSSQRVHSAIVPGHVIPPQPLDRDVVSVDDEDHSEDSAPLILTPRTQTQEIMNDLLHEICDKY